MTILALEIGPSRFAAIEIADNVGPEGVQAIPVPERQAWERCRELLLDIAAGREVTSVGVASSGPIDMASGVVAPPEVLEWQAGFPLVESLSGLFPQAEVRLGLDGVCLSLAERHFGGTREVLDSLSILVEDRIVGGVMVGGFVLVGRTGNAGQIGHVLVPGFDEPCSCGGRGCLEAVAGGAALVRWANGQGWGGASLSALVSAAEQGESVPVAALERAGKALGTAITSVAALLDLDRVVIGGPLSQAGTSLWKPLNNAIAMHARLSFLPGLRAVPSDLGDVGLLAGAGVLALTALES
ncbi:ROK family protein [Nocardia paucivorans]|uniref:ROK family protein n=1 Tax=Nocardia paucivorans TaxID=114259 RepID=UPI00030CD766|nr:ROK family protein [Nocardia paucivorans]